MAILSYSKVVARAGRAYANALLRNQKLYSPHQVDMARGYPHLVWITGQVPLSRKLRLKVWDRSDGYCTYCGISLCEETFTVDHIHPIAAGGSDAISNLTIACRPCNSKKGARIDG